MTSRAPENTNQQGPQNPNNRVAPGFDPFGPGPALNPQIIGSVMPNLAPAVAVARTPAQEQADIDAGASHYLTFFADPNQGGQPNDARTALTYREAQIAARAAFRTPATAMEIIVGTLEPIRGGIQNPPPMTTEKLFLTNNQYSAIVQAIAADVAAHPADQHTPLPETTGGMTISTIPSLAGVLSPPPAPAGTVQPGFFARLWAWLKGLWARVFGAPAPKPAGTQGIGVGATAIEGPGWNSYAYAGPDGWTFRTLATGEVLYLSPAQGRAAIEAASAVPPPPARFHPGSRTIRPQFAPPMYALHNNAGIGMALDRAQGLAALRAIDSFQGMQSELAYHIQSAVERPMLTQVGVNVPYLGGRVYLDERTWRDAFGAAARGVGAGSNPGDPSDAALGVLELANDPDSMQEIAMNAAAGDMNACLLAKALVDAQLAFNRMVALSILDGVAQGDDAAMSKAQSYLDAAAAGDDSAAMIGRTIGDALAMGSGACCAGCASGMGCGCN